MTDHWFEARDSSSYATRSHPLRVASKRDYASPHHLYAGTYYDVAFTALRGGSVLELGCANGRIGELIRANAPSVKELHGVDYDADLLAAAPGDLYSSLQQVDLESDLPRPAEPFTDILALDVLEHLRDPRGTLQRLAPLLKPGGRLVIGVPNFLQLRNRLRILAGRWSYQETGGLYDEGHLRWYSKANLHQLVPPSHFDIVNVGGYGWFPRGSRLANRPVADMVMRAYLRRVAAPVLALRPQLLARSLVIVCERRDLE
jgi:SAM-dependent methyltransferase